MSLPAELCFYAAYGPHDFILGKESRVIQAHRRLRRTRSRNWGAGSRTVRLRMGTLRRPCGGVMPGCAWSPATPLGTPPAGCPATAMTAGPAPARPPASFLPLPTTRATAAGTIMPMPSRSFIRGCPLRNQIIQVVHPVPLRGKRRVLKNLVRPLHGHAFRV